MDGIEKSQNKMVHEKAVVYNLGLSRTRARNLDLSTQSYSQLPGLLLRVIVLSTVLMIQGIRQV